MVVTAVTAYSEACCQLVPDRLILVNMEQISLINKVKKIAEEDTNVSAVLMYGSFTKGEGDKYSDIEFYIFLNDKANFSSHSWVAQVLPTYLYFTNEYGSEVAIFNNLIRGEFHFLPREEIKIILSWEGFVRFSEIDKMILVDKEGRLSSVLSQINVPRPDRCTQENIVWLSQSLLNVLLVTANLIKREEYAHAYQSLSNVQKFLLWLIRVNVGQTDHWESPTKSLEKELDTIWYLKFQEVTAELEPKKIRLAFENSLRLSQELFQGLAVDADLQNLLDRITDYGLNNRIETAF